MASEGPFPMGLQYWILQRRPIGFFQGWTVGKFHFINFQTKRKTVFYENIYDKISHFKIQSGPRPPYHHIPTPICRAMRKKAIIWKIWVTSKRNIFRIYIYIKWNKAKKGTMQVEESEVKCLTPILQNVRLPPPTFPKFPTPTPFIKWVKFGCQEFCSN